MAIELNARSIMDAVLATELDFANINDIEAGDGEYVVTCGKLQKAEDTPFVWFKPKTGTNARKFKASARQLAAARVFGGSGVPGVEWSRDFLTAPDCRSFQDLCFSRASESADWLLNATFVCIKQLKVRNQNVPGDVPLYKRKFYKGFQAYSDALVDVRKQHGDNYWESLSGRVAVAALRKTLEQSGLVDGVTDADRVLIPVFRLK